MHCCYWLNLRFLFCFKYMAKGLGQTLLHHTAANSNTLTIVSSEKNFIIIYCILCAWHGSSVMFETGLHKWSIIFCKILPGPTLVNDVTTKEVFLHTALNLVNSLLLVLCKVITPNIIILKIDWWEFFQATVLNSNIMLPT